MLSRRSFALSSLSLLLVTAAGAHPHETLNAEQNGDIERQIMASGPP